MTSTNHTVDLVTGVITIHNRTGYDEVNKILRDLDERSATAHYVGHTNLAFILDETRKPYSIAIDKWDTLDQRVGEDKGGYSTDRLTGDIHIFTDKGAEDIKTLLIDARSKAADRRATVGVKALAEARVIKYERALKTYEERKRLIEAHYEQDVIRLIKPRTQENIAMPTGYTHTTSGDGTDIIVIHSDHGYKLSCERAAAIHNSLNANTPPPAAQKLKMLDEIATHLAAQKVWLLTPKPDLVKLEAACKAMADDYQSSFSHHPDHILVNREDFDNMLAALGRDRLLTAEEDAALIFRKKNEPEPEPGEHQVVLDAINGCNSGEDDG